MSGCPWAWSSPLRRTLFLRAQNDAGNRRAMGAGQGHFVIANPGPGLSGRPDDRLTKQSIAGKIIDCSSPFGLLAMTVLDRSKTIEL